MKCDPADALPVVGSASSSELGVRPGIDIHVNAVGEAVLDGNGMSVSPGWRSLEYTRIPKRLRHIVPGAKGPNSTSCFFMGSGAFENGPVADGLELIVDHGTGPATHGVIAPSQLVSLARFQSDLVSTRAEWRIDEA